MNIILSMILFSFFGCATILHAQIKTFDVKRPLIQGEPGYLGNPQRISPTRTIALAGNWKGGVYIVTLNNDGIIENSKDVNFKQGDYGCYFQYYENSLVFITPELTPSQQSSPEKNRLRVIVFDSNLVERSDKILDSSITGYPTDFDKNILINTIKLQDSTILITLSTRVTIKDNSTTLIHLTKSGDFINRITKHDSIPYVSYVPILQMRSGKILFQRAIRNQSTGFPSLSICLSDTAFTIDNHPVIDSATYDGIISTSDGGILWANYFYEFDTNTYPNGTAIVKYDKNFQKQWTSFVPGDSYSKRLQLIESRTGGYYITTSGYDTSLTKMHPKVFSFCFLDIVLSRLDTSGKVKFSAFYGSEFCTESPDFLLEDLDGGLVIAGGYNQSPYPNCEYLCDEKSSVWLFKVDSLGGPAKKIVGVDEKNEITFGMKLFPNPTSGILTVELGKAGYYTSVEVLDLQGRVLYSSPIEDSKQQLAGVDISGFASGSYYCRLKAPHNLIVRPFVIQK